MVPVNVGTLSPGWWSVVNCAGPKMIESLSFSPALTPVESCCAIDWCSDCSSWPRAESKSASVISGVEDGSVPPPVACGLVTVTFDPSNGSQQCSICVIVWSPTFPTEPGVTAITLTVFWPPFQGTTVSAEVCANSIPFVFVRRCPYLKSRPGEPDRLLGSWRLFVYTTCPIAGASGTVFEPVTLKPC